MTGESADGAIIVSHLVRERERERRSSFTADISPCSCALFRVL